jgi:hypothetical protein
MSWQNYIETFKEANSYKKRIRRYISDRNKMLGKGGQKNTPPFTQRMSKHVTFDKQLEEVEEESFQIHDELQPEVWQEERLNSEARERLIEIAANFLEGLEIPVSMNDLRFTGSLANYNWSKYSDIDLHIVVDFSKVDENTELVKAFFDEARLRWNDKHRITIHGFEVEIYVENIDEEHKSSGIYSITNDEWIIKPDPIEQVIDFETAEKKSQDYVDRAQRISNLVSDGKYELALRHIERVKEKIRDMRKVGLESEEAEFSAENIAFKILRRDQILKRLNDLKADAYDNMMTIKDE